jgi:hypothetical protein
MQTVWERRRASALALLIVCAALVAGCPTAAPEDFVSISQHGFEQTDYARDLNDYPWAMAYFTPDGSDVGRLYVGTGNNIPGQAIASFNPAVPAEVAYRPAEIRRYRPEQGSKVWERAFDYRDVATAAELRASGFRSMAVYRARADDVTYLYAGTAGLEPSLWRSATGDPGTWRQVWSNPFEGSIRALAANGDLLYVGVSRDASTPPLPAEIYATDGDAVWPVVDDGFGSPDNVGVYSLASFNGWLYAGTANAAQGCEVWKLEGDGEESQAVRVVAAGGPSPSNASTTQMVVFQGRLYVAMMVKAGLKRGGFPFRGADMVRLDDQDNVETVVGSGSVGGVESGFGDITNAYLWSLVEHDGKLYCGTWDSASIFPVGLAGLPRFLAALAGNFKSRSWLDDFVTDIGAELYVSSDGVHWDPVFTDGLGNPGNYGVRNMDSGGGTLYLGMANVLEGLEIWRMREPQP